MITDNMFLVSFDVVNMYPTMDNDRGIAAARNALETRANKTASTDCIKEGHEICLKCNNSRFDSQNLLQLNGTETDARMLIKPFLIQIRTYSKRKKILTFKNEIFSSMS